MKLFSAFLLLAAATVGLFAQEPPAPPRRAIRIPIRHADPYFVKAMLEGQQVMAPEISTIAGIVGGAAVGQATQQAANAANALFHDGFFVVNPTDNSLWFFPKKGS